MVRGISARWVKLLTDEGYAIALPGTAVMILVILICLVMGCFPKRIGTILIHRSRFPAPGA
jgi:TRAP-type C4-dicarboxylate transport system permease large subunit